MESSDDEALVTPVDKVPKIQNLTSPRNRSGGPIPRKNALAQVSATSQEDEDDPNLGEDLFVPSKRASKTASNSKSSSERGSRKTASAAQQPPVASKTVPPWPSSSSETEDQDDEDKDVSYGSHRKPNSSPVKRKKTTTTPSRTTPQRTTPSRTPSGRTPSGRTPSRTPQRQTPQRQTPQRTQEVYFCQFLSIFQIFLIL